MLRHSTQVNGCRLHRVRALLAGYPGKEIKQSFFYLLCFDEHSFCTLIILFRGAERGW
jgi:hypothetical protein